MMLLQRLFSIAFISSNLYASMRIGADRVPRTTPEKSTLPSRLNFPSGSPTSQRSEAATSLSASSWSSYMTVDPSSLLSVLVKKAGFFLDPKLKSLASLLHCDEAKLNVAQKELLISNFTVSLPNSIESLKIGRIYVTWDSYSRPCLEIQVENVDILVEFVNLLFTRNNWYVAM